MRMWISFLLTIILGCIIFVAMTTFFDWLSKSVNPVYVYGVLTSLFLYLVWSEKRYKH